MGCNRTSVIKPREYADRRGIPTSSNPSVGGTSESSSPPGAGHTVATARYTAPYPRPWNAIPILSGLFDPVAGVYAAVESIFRRYRIPAEADTPSRRRQGVTFVLGGIEGPSRYGAFMARGLLRSDYRGSVVRVPWNNGVPVLRCLKNLMSLRHHERQADRLVERILDHQSRHPESPVCLLAQSGGCWIVIRALEMLPANAFVRTAILLSPSISPDHDLHAAAARCRRSLISVGGPGDVFYLGIGTTVFGTSNRVHAPSAGWIGWHHHSPQFTEVRWHPSWLRHGYLGNHVTSAASGFVERVIAPYLN